MVDTKKRVSTIIFCVKIDKKVCFFFFCFTGKADEDQIFFPLQEATVYSLALMVKYGKQKEWYT